MRLPAVASIRGLLPRFSALLAAGVILGAGWAGTASALSFDPNPVSFDDGTVAGTITLTSTTGVPSGGVVDPDVGDGSVASTDITIVFQVSVTSGTLDAIGASVFEPAIFSGPDISGAGDVPGSGDQSASDIGPSGSNGAEFKFLAGDPASGTLGAGETSDLLFISFASVKTDGTQVVNFMISPDGGGSDFTESSTIAVPEPATLLLAFAGLAGLLRASRRTR